MIATALLGFGTFILYLWTLAPGPGWLDTSELAAGAFSLGVVHPPAHPVWVMLAKAATLLPFGSIGFRVNLLSAGLGTVSVLLLAGITARVATAATGLARSITCWTGLSAGALFAITGACWLQSIRAEVYTLNAALVLAGTWCAVRWLTRPTATGGHRWLTLFAVCFGLGLGNHHYLTFFLLPAPLLVLLLDPVGRRWLASPRVLAAGALVLVALTAYAYLPLRALTDPLINWADPRTPARFWDVLTARTFQASVSTETRSLPLTENLAVAMGMFIEQLSPIGFLAGLGGAMALLRMAPRLALLLLVALFANLLTKGLMFIDPENPDDYGYFMLGIAMLASCAGLLPALIPATGRLRTSIPMLGAVLVTGLAAAVAVATPQDLADDHSAEVITDGLLAPVEPDAVVLVRYPGLFFNQWYAQLIDGKRPDVTVVQQTFDAARYDGEPYLRALLERAPSLEPVVTAFRRTHALPFDALLALSRSRPVYVQPTVETPLPPTQTGPAGIVRQLGTTASRPASVGASGADADARIWAPMLRSLAQSTLRPEARQVLDWIHFLQAGVAVRQGDGAQLHQILTRWESLTRTTVPPPLVQIAGDLLAAERAVTTASPETQPEATRQLAALRATLRTFRAADLLGR